MIELDPDRVLALAYVPTSVRSAVEALWRLDAALGSVLATGNDPMISRIRLAWWRESLEKLDREKAPAEPVLQAVVAQLLPRGIKGAELAEMESGWATLLSPEALTDDDLRLYASARGGGLFLLTARLLGEASPLVEAGGRAWALTDLARHSASPADAEAAMLLARESSTGATWPKRLRPLGMLAALAARDARRGLDFEPFGAPRRMLRMIGHRLTGR